MRDDGDNSVPAARLSKSALGLVALGVVAWLLLRPLVGAFQSDAGIVWLNPHHVLAGFGFGGLLLSLVAGGLFQLVRRESLSGRFAVFLIAVTLLTVAVKGTVVRRVAKSAGYTRCVAADRFQAGNVKKNDVTLQAWAKPGRCPTDAR